MQMGCGLPRRIVPLQGTLSCAVGAALLQGPACLPLVPQVVWHRHSERSEMLNVRETLIQSQSQI